MSGGTGKLGAPLAHGSRLRKAPTPTPATTATATAAPVKTIDFSEKRKQSLLDELYRRHFQKLVNWLTRRYGEGPPDPEDLAQAAFLKLSQSPDFFAIKDLRAYLYTTAVRNFIDGYRRQKTMANFLKHELNKYQDEVGEITPERVFLSRERLQHFSAALKNMSPKQREIVIRSRILGQTFEEITRQTGWSKSAIGRHLQTAIQELTKADNKKT